jgi:hypothetical protein
MENGVNEALYYALTAHLHESITTDGLSQYTQWLGGKSYRDVLEGFEGRHLGSTPDVNPVKAGYCLRRLAGREIILLRRFKVGQRELTVQVKPQHIMSVLTDLRATGTDGVPFWARQFGDRLGNKAQVKHSR